MSCGELCLTFSACPLPLKQLQGVFVDQNFHEFYFTLIDNARSLTKVIGKIEHA